MREREAGPIAREDLVDREAIGDDDAGVARKTSRPSAAISLRRIIVGVAVSLLLTGAPAVAQWAINPGWILFAPANDVSFTISTGKALPHGDHAETISDDAEPSRDVRIG
jgi:hypothetical protein